MTALGPKQDRLFSRNSAIAIAVLFIVAAFMLWTQGRVWWCQEGDWAPWSWDIWTPHNSQHVLDPYAFTHVLHGIIEFWLIGLICRKMPMAWRLVLAVAIEGTWEVVENSAFIIERYRTATLSLDYFGDSMINSLADMVCCAAGFLVAYKIRFWKSLALFIATEAILIFWIRDSLIINIIMLISPIEAIKAWQLAGQ
ncbi:MAG: DUF2585 family protein [Pyrinomonadaceae bacterium]